MKSTYKRDQNRIYRARRRTRQKCFYLHSCILKLEVYPLDVYEFHDFFYYINKLDKIENPYDTTFTALI